MASTICFIFLTAAVLFTSSSTSAEGLHIESTATEGQAVVIRGTTAIPSDASTYIQYYVGKLYDGTLTTCIYADGFHADEDGTFSLEIPYGALKGDGLYEIVLEQNPRGNAILPPSHWIAFRRTEGGIVFGDITSMGEIANLALTVGMELTQRTFSVK